MSFLLFDYTSSAMKNTTYNFRSRLAASQEPGLLFEKTKYSRTPNSHSFLYFFEVLHTCSSYQWLQSFSLVCFVPLNKKKQSSFSEHVDPKRFLTFLLISTDTEKKKKTISTDIFESIDKENMQNFREN